MKKIAIDEFTKLKMISSPKFSADGKSFCFVMTEASMEKDSYISHICRLEDDGTVTQLTNGGSENDFIYIDPTTLLYASESSPVKTVYSRIDLKSGNISKAFSVSLAVSDICLAENNKYLLLAAVYPGYEKMYTGDPKVIRSYLRQRKENADYEEFDTLPWWRDGGTFTRGSYTGLFSYDAVTKETSMLTPAGFFVRSFHVTPDGKTIFISGGPVKENYDLMFYSDFWKMDITGSDLRVIQPARNDFAVTDCVPGDDYAVVLATDLSHGCDTDSDFYKLSYDDYSLTLIKKWDRRIESSIYSDVMHYGGQMMKLQGDALYFTSTVDEEHPLFKLEDGEISRISQGEGDVKCFDLCGDKIIMVAQLNMKAQELYDGKGRQLTRINDKQLKGKYVAVPERLNIDSEGREIRGFVYKPINFTGGGKYPAIMYIHGGPKSDLGPVFFNMFQYWTSCGYFVFCCNPYGSDGRGSEFGDMMDKYFTKDYTDLMNFCDAVLDKYPEIDRNNLFETGISYGGIMTNWIIGHTDRFSACVSQASISNLLSFNISDIGPSFGLDQFGSTLWSDAAHLWEKSPLKYADKAKTPTLFIHALTDYRCPIDQGLQMYAALKLHNVDTRFFMIRGESHGLFEIGRPSHRVRYTQEITRWFDEHKK